MPKLPPELEGPLDNIIVNSGDKIDSYFYKAGFSANDITSLSLISGLSSIYTFYKGQYLWSGILLFVSYIFDCMDGHFARKYNFVSKFGDYYDHIKDWIVSALIFYFLISHYYPYGSALKYVYLIVLAVLLLVSIMHLGCQEVYYNKPTTTLQLTTYFCPANDKQGAINALKYTRYFSVAVFHIALSLFIAFTPYFTSLLNNNGNGNNYIFTCE